MPICSTPIWTKWRTVLIPRSGQLDHDDDAMDEIHGHLFTILLDPQWPHPAATAVDVTLLSRYYERFADHAVTIGRRVIFQATGAPIT